jgi:hypothetical protein
MGIGRGNGIIQKKPAPVLLFPPQISLELTWDRTLAAAVESQRLTAWAMARPTYHLKFREVLSGISFSVTASFDRVYGSTALCLVLADFQFLDLTQAAGLLGRVISPTQGFYLNTGQHIHRINTYTHQTSMPWVGFEPTITASERAKTVNDLDRAATVTGSFDSWIGENN